MSVTLSKKKKEDKKEETKSSVKKEKKEKKEKKPTEPVEKSLVVKEAEVPEKKEEGKSKNPFLFFRKKEDGQNGHALTRVEKKELKEKAKQEEERKKLLALQANPLYIAYNGNDSFKSDSFYAFNDYEPDPSFGKVFYEFAELLNESADKVKDDTVLFLIKKYMEKVGKVIVRQNVTDSELENIITNAYSINAHEILLAPAYIPSCAKHVYKNGMTSLKVNALVDFPFGESTYKAKSASIKDSLKMGVDGVCVMMPSMILTDSYEKEFKKQIKKFGRTLKSEGGIAVSAMDVGDEQLKKLFRFVEKSRLGYINLVFGEVTENELKEKMVAVNKVKGKKPVNIIANIDSYFTVTEMFKLGINNVLTPYADYIGKQLLERFNVKSINLK